MLDCCVADLVKVLGTTWKHAAVIEEAIKHKIPELLGLDRAFQNARMYSDRQNMKVEAESAIRRAMALLLSNYLDLFTKFAQDPEFRGRLTLAVLERVDGEAPGRQSAPLPPRE